MATREDAFITDFAEALQQSVTEGWDTETLDSALVAVAQDHGYWFPGLQASVGVSFDAVVANASAYLDLDTGTLQLGGGIPFPARSWETAIDNPPLSTRVVPTPGLSAQTSGFAEVNIGGENVFRRGIRYDVEMDAGLGQLTGSVNAATDGTMVASLTGELGRFGLGVGGQLSFPMIDTDHVIEAHLPLFEQTLAGEGGREAAREIISDILDESGGGWIPTERLVFAAAVSDYEASDAQGMMRISHHDGPGTLGETAQSFGLRRIEGGIADGTGDEPAFYRIDGVLAMGGAQLNGAGAYVQEYGGIIDATGRVLNGYVVESLSGAATRPQHFDFNGQWSGDLGTLVGVERYQGGHREDADIASSRQALVDVAEARLATLEHADLPQYHATLRGEPGFTLTCEQLELGIYSPTHPMPLEQAAETFLDTQDAARAAIAEHSAAGTLRVDEAVTGKLLSETGTTLMIEGLRQAGVETVDIPIYNGVDPVMTARAYIEGIAVAHQIAELDMPDSIYRPELDATGISSEGFETVLEVRAAEGRRAGDAALQDGVREEASRNVHETVSKVDAHNVGTQDVVAQDVGSEQGLPLPEDTGNEMETAF